MKEFTFQDRRIIALGERDGISGAALSKLVEKSGGTLAFAVTECFV